MPKRQPNADRRSQRPQRPRRGRPTPGDRPARPGAGPSRRPRSTSGPKRPRPAQPVPGRATPSGVRLQRVMADAGVSSRRDCEQMILDGRVEVNDHPVTELPVFVDPATDRIRVDGRLLPLSGRNAPRPGRPRVPVGRVYVMLNKPDNTLGTTKDELEYAKGGRRTVIDLVQHPSGARLFPVGRLAFHDTGLVLMTNDGDLAERLTHARYGITKTYRVWISGSVRPDILDMLRRRVGKKDATDPEGRPTGGVRLVGTDDETPPGANASNRRHREQRPPRRPTHGATPPKGDTTILEVEVREGRTEPLADMLLAVGCRVRRIARTAIGPLHLVGVRPGEWRDLTRDELKTLKDATGLSQHKPSAPRRKERAASESTAQESEALPTPPAEPVSAGEQTISPPEPTTSEEGDQ